MDLAVRSWSFALNTVVFKQSSAHRNFCIMKYRPWTADQLRIKTREKNKIKLAEKRKSLKQSVSLFASALFTESDSQDFPIDKPITQRNAHHSRDTSFNAVTDSPPPSQLKQKTFSSKSPCAGCGASLHSINAEDPGYLPYDLLRPVFQDKHLLRITKCLRCLCLSTDANYLEDSSNATFSLSVSETQAFEILQILRKRNADAVVLLVVDMTDLSNAVPKDLFSILGLHRFVILGNKIDLLPQDGDGWKERWSRALRRECVQRGGIPENTIEAIHLISAVTLKGFPELLLTLFSNKLRGPYPFYLVGSTNSGKSSVFNRLLKSDFCHAEARSHLDCATESTWPGTTMAVLKFPISKISQSKRHLLDTHLKDTKNQDAAVKMEPVLLDPNSHVMQKDQSLSVIPAYKRLLSDNGNDSLLSSDKRSSEISIQKEFMDPGKMMDGHYSQVRWCYDTPGIVNQSQLINYLTAEEMKLMSPTTKKWLPRYLNVRSGLSLLIGGLARVDIMESTKPTTFLLVVFSLLPLHLMPTENVQEYLKDCRKHLLVPQLITESNAEDSNMNALDLTGVDQGGRSLALPTTSAFRDFVINGQGMKICAADVIFSSAGWISVACANDVTLRCFTPGGIGLQLRQPALLPKVLNYRGERIRSTREYDFLKDVPKDWQEKIRKVSVPQESDSREKMMMKF